MNMASMLLPASPPKAKIAELGLILQQQTQLLIRLYSILVCSDSIAWIVQQAVGRIACWVATNLLPSRLSWLAVSIRIFSACSNESSLFNVRYVIAVHERCPLRTVGR